MKSTPIFHLFCSMIVAFLTFGHLQPSLAKAQTRSPVVLFDHGHGQAFRFDRNGELDLSILKAMFKAQGFRSAMLEGEATFEELAKADVLVISGPFKAYSQIEIRSILNFLEHGGGLCIMIHVPHPLGQVLEELGLAFSSGVVHEQVNVIGSHDTDFMISSLNSHPITKGLESFALYGGWALNNFDKNADELAFTSKKAWVDLNRNHRLEPGRDAMQPFCMAVAGQYGKGRFVVFGDDAIFQNKFITQGNKRLARNVIKWLKTCRYFDKAHSPQLYSL